MAETLDYDHVPASPRRRLMPAMVIALVGGPALAVGAAVFGCSLALGSWPLSSPNLSYSITWGAVCGVVGGPVIALLAWVLRDTAMSVSVVGSVVVALLSGASLFLYAAMLAAC